MEHPRGPSVHRNLPRRLESHTMPEGTAWHHVVACVDFVSTERDTKQRFLSEEIDPETYPESQIGHQRNDAMTNCEEFRGAGK